MTNMKNVKNVKNGMNAQMPSKKEKPEFISTVKAAQLAFVTKPTIIAWCEKYGIGRKRVGRWIVNKDKLDQLLVGELGNEKNKAN